MTDVQGPDGIVRFPDDMTPADIQAAMQKNYPIQPVAQVPVTAAGGATSPAPPAPPAGPDEGVGASFLRGMNKQIPFAQQAVAAANTLLPESLGGTKGWDYNANLAMERSAQEQAQQQHPIAGNLGQGTGSVIAAAPFAAIGAPPVAGLAERAGYGALQGAGIGGLQAASQGQDIGANALAGGAVGGAIPLATALGGKIVSPFAKAPPKMGDQFTSEILNQGNIPGNSVRPQTLAAAKSTIVDNLNDIAGRNTLVPDQQLHSDIAAAAGGPNKLISPTETAHNAAASLLDEVPLSGEMSGADYAKRRSELSDKAFNLRFSDPTNSDVYRGLRNALDSGMDRSIAANNPGDAGLLPGIRQSYGNLLNVAGAASKIKGPDLVQGVLPPSRLAAVLSAGNKGPAYAMGQGSPLTGLTQSAMENIAPATAGPTIPPWIAHHLASALGRGAVGAGIGYEGGGWQGAAAGAAAGALAPKVLNSRLVNNQLAPKIGAALSTSVTPYMVNLARALAIRQAAQRSQGQ